MDITLNNANVHIATGGKDFDASLPTVLFLHGSGGDHRTWALQTRWFAFHGYSVLAPDLPGHSLSAGEPFGSIEESAPWLVNLLDALGVESAHVVGHSQGFLSGLELAKLAPEKVTSITAVATAASISVNQALIDTAKADNDKAAMMMCNWGFGPQAHIGQSATPGMQPIAMSRAIMGRNPLAVDLQACADYQGGAEAVEGLTCSRHAILATHDKMTHIKAGTALAKAMGITPTIIQGHGHMLPLEAPKETLTAIASFIETVE